MSDRATVDRAILQMAMAMLDWKSDDLSPADLDVFSAVMNHPVVKNALRKRLGDHPTAVVCGVCGREVDGPIRLCEPCARWSLDRETRIAPRRVKP